MTKIKFLFSFFATLLFANNVFASLPENWQLGFQEANSPMMRSMVETHDFIMIFVWGISIFVLLLLIYTCLRFREKKNPIPSKTTHNSLLETIWIIIPTIIVIIVAIPSIKLIIYQEKIPETEMTLKVIGRQWYWSYEYPDHKNIAFDSYMKKDNELLEGEPRLLATDNKIILPVNTYIKVQITSSDVIHSWALPALGVKKDAIPGKLNETWIYIEKEGAYYGQCSELCGVLHAFMPIEIKAVSKAAFEQWTVKMQDELASNVSHNLRFANNNLTNN